MKLTRRGRGDEQAILSGNAVDIVKLIPGKSMNDIVDVIPHDGRSSAYPEAFLDYNWCLFGESKE